MNAINKYLCLHFYPDTWLNVCLDVISYNLNIFSADLITTLCEFILKDCLSPSLTHSQVSFSLSFSAVGLIKLMGDGIFLWLNEAWTPTDTSWWRGWVMLRKVVAQHSDTHTSAIETTLTCMHNHAPKTHAGTTCKQLKKINILLCVVHSHVCKSACTVADHLRGPLLSLSHFN